MEPLIRTSAYIGAYNMHKVSGAANVPLTEASQCYGVLIEGFLCNAQFTGWDGKPDNNYDCKACYARAIACKLLSSLCRYSSSLNVDFVYRFVYIYIYPCLKYGGRLVSKLLYCSLNSVEISFGYTILILVYTFFIQVYTPFSFGYTYFIWVHLFHLKKKFKFQTLILLFYQAEKTW